MTFLDMARIVPEGRSGNCEIKHYRVSRRGPDPNGHIIERGTYCMLYVDGQLMMSDQQKEWTSSRPVLENARGDVLIAGLGIGLILPSLCRNPEVETITVVEKSRDVVRLVAPSHIHDKVFITIDDINKWEPPLPIALIGYSAIWLDIWPTFGRHMLPEMKRLIKRLKPYLREGGWMGIWGLQESLEASKRPPQGCEAFGGAILCNAGEYY